METDQWGSLPQEVDGFCRRPGTYSLDSSTVFDVCFGEVHLLRPVSDAMWHTPSEGMPCAPTAPVACLHEGVPPPRLLFMGHPLHEGLHKTMIRFFVNIVHLFAFFVFIRAYIVHKFVPGQRQ